MADEFEAKCYVLQLRLKEPGAEHNTCTLSSRAGLGNTLAPRIIPELTGDGFIKAREQPFPRTFSISNRHGAERALRSRGTVAANEAGT